MPCAFVKNKEITISNWESNQLSQSQIIYAATDAIYGYYAFLQSLINIKHSKLDFSLVSNDEKQKIILDDHLNNNILQKKKDLILKLCYGIIDIAASIALPRGTNNYCSKNNFRKIKKGETCDMNSIKKPWTHGTLLDYDGTLITSHLRYKTAMKLLNTGFVVQIDDNTIQYQEKRDRKIQVDNMKTTKFKFEMYRENGIFYGDRQYCLICGNKEQLKRFGMIPSLYVKYYYCEKLGKSNKTKKNCWVLLCNKCFSKAENVRYKFQRNICQKYGINTDFDPTKCFQYSNKEKQMLRIAKAARIVQDLSGNSFDLETKEEQKLQGCLNFMIQHSISNQGVK